MYQKAILHLDLDAFFASVEIRKNSALRGLPVLVGGTGGRGVIASCSYEARRFGIHTGMRTAVALQRCPDARLIRGDYEDYERESRVVTELLTEQSPVFEKAAIDEFYVDLTGMDRHFGCVKWSGELRERIIRETGLPLSAGLSVNKLVAKVRGGEARPNGSGWVAAGRERDFLAPLPVRKLPSVGRETARKLSLLGIRKTGTLSEIPVDLLRREFGKQGAELHRRANGIDHRPVVPYTERTSLSREHTFQTDTIDVEELRQAVRTLTKDLGYELRAAGKVTSRITVKLRYTDSNTYNRSITLPYTAHDGQLLPVAEELFRKLFVRRQCVRLVGVRFERLTAGHTQLDLFADRMGAGRLLAALDGVRG